MSRNLKQAAALLMAIPLTGFALSGCSTSSGASPAAKPSITVNLSEWNVGIDQTTLKPGVYTFKIHNAGTIEHELIAFHGTDLAGLPIKDDGGVNEDAAGLDKTTDGDNIAVGATQTRSVDLTKPGTYVFMCNLPAHFKAGMHTVVTVS